MTRYQMNSMLIWACQIGQIEIVRRLLTTERFTIEDCTEVLDWACINGHVEVVRLLLADGRADPTISTDIKFTMNDNIIELLLADKRVDLDNCRYLLR